MSVVPEAAPEVSADRIIMHIDFDYFFAQCEELRRPELKELPVVVCAYSGRTKTSGVVSTSNYLARRHGVKSGIPIASAISRLSGAGINAVFLPIDRPYYSDISSSAMAAVQSKADIFEQRGIDECYIDVSSSTDCNYVVASELARTIKTAIKSTVGLTSSIGVAPNKLMAKIASDFRKPDGLTVIQPSKVPDLISQLDVRSVPGVGPKTAQLLAERLSVRKVRDLQRWSSFELESIFGNKVGAYLFRAARGIDDEPVMQSAETVRQISHIVTLKQDAETEVEMLPYVERICTKVFQRTSEQNVSFGTITLILILSNLRNLTRSKSLKTSTSGYAELESTAHLLLREFLRDGLDRKVRRIGLRVSDLHGRSGEKSILDFVS